MVTKPLQILLLLGLAFGAAQASATEKSISLYSKGLVALHRNDLSEAAILMDRAVAADPRDPYAVYYRGVVKARRGDSDGAIADLTTALRLKPDFPEAELDLGVAQVDAGNYEAAESHLKNVSSDPKLRGNATLFLGIARLRQGQNEASLVDFDQVPALDPSLATTARYYRGVALSRLGRSDEARESFERVIAEKPGSELATEAQSFLAIIESGLDQPKKYRIYAGYGMDYDSNVVLKLDDESVDDLGVEDDSDVAFTLRLGGQYSLWRGTSAALSISYDFFQRLYLQLDDYNLQGHHPSLHWTARWNDLRFGLSGDYEFYLLKTDAYLQRPSAQPWLAWQAGDWGRTEISYQVRWNDFLSPPPGGAPVFGLDGDFADSEDALDSISHQPRIRQYIYFNSPRRYLSVGYLFEYRDPTKSAGDPFEYYANQVDVAAATPLFSDFDLFGSYTYRREDYAEGGRLDQPHIFIVSLRWQLARWFAASLGYFGELHNSNQFEYDRHIASVGFDLSF